VPTLPFQTLICFLPVLLNRQRSLLAHTAFGVTGVWRLSTVVVASPIDGLWLRQANTLRCQRRKPLQHPKSVSASNHVAARFESIDAPDRRYLPSPSRRPAYRPTGSPYEPVGLSGQTIRSVSAGASAFSVALRHPPTVTMMTHARKSHAASKNTPNTIFIPTLSGIY
jgi:hypothetical protein